MSGQAERTSDEPVGFEAGAPAIESQPTTEDGVPRTQEEDVGRADDPREVTDHGDPVNLVEILQELRLLRGRFTELQQENETLKDKQVEMQRLVDQGFAHFDGRVNRSRAAEMELRDRLRSTDTRGMPALMPSDLKAAKIQNLSSTDVDKIRNWFRHARGHLKFYNIDPEEQRSVFWAAGFLDGPLSKWWHSRVATTGEEVHGGFRGVTEMETELIKEFSGRTPAEQARLNLDKARQRTTVLKYANYFREQLLELPQRHEDDNVHDFQKGLNPSIHKEVALKNPKTLADAIQAALRAEAAEQKIANSNRTKTARLNVMDSDSEEADDSDGTEEDAEDDGADLYEIRRLTKEEVEQYQKEGRCFSCKKKGHLARNCPQNKNGKNTKKPRSGK